MTARRRPRSDEVAHSTVLHPAISWAAHRLGAEAVGLIDVGCSSCLNLVVDRVGIAYSNGQFLGDSASPVQLSATIVGGRPVPDGSVPEVVARIGIDRNPVDVTDPDDVRWLRASLLADQADGPDRADRADRSGRLESAALLEAALALAAQAPPQLLRGDPVALLSDALTAVPAEALPVFITTWALSRFPAARRQQFVDNLLDATNRRPLAWVSAEGVGVAPSIPTFGDRPASGHSIIGVAVSDPHRRAGLRVEAVGRCWSRGRLLSWLAAS